MLIGKNGFELKKKMGEDLNKMHYLSLSINTIHDFSFGQFLPCGHHLRTCTRCYKLERIELISRSINDWIFQTTNVIRTCKKKNLIHDKRLI